MFQLLLFILLIDSSLYNLIFQQTVDVQTYIFPFSIISSLFNPIPALCAVPAISTRGVWIVFLDPGENIKEKKLLSLLGL